MQRAPRRQLLLVGCMLAALCLGLGCRPNLSPVYEPEGSVVATASGLSPTADGVRGAILRAMTTKHWTVVGSEPGVILAHVNSGGHFATVRIEYDAEGYVILHEETSPGLKFDGDAIHRRYNHWIKGLNVQIQVELTRL